MIIIDYKDRRPIYEQVVERFQKLILMGVLEVDSQLPSVRNLAMDLSINPNTIQKAYTELERQGYIYSVKGKGSFIAATEQLRQDKEKELFISLKFLIKEALEYGITEQEFILKIKEGYKGEEKDD